MHTGRIMAYVAIGAASAYGASRLYSYMKHRGPSINEKAATELPPPMPEKLVVKAEPSPVVKSRANLGGLGLVGEARSLTPRVDRRFSMRDDGTESGTPMLAYIPALSLTGPRDSDGVATGAGSVYVDTPTVETARSTERTSTPSPSGGLWDWSVFRNTGNRTVRV